MTKNTQKEIDEELNRYKEIKKKINKIRRSPKIGEIYKIYNEQQELTLKKTTLNRQHKIYTLYLGQLEKIRADDLEPLFIQEKILKHLFKQKKFTTLLYVTRLLVTLLDFAKACNLIKNNSLKEIYTLPIIKKSQKEMSRNTKHRPTLAYEDLRYNLMQLIKTFTNKACLRRILLLDLSLRTILRPREVCSLKITDLDLEKHILKVHNTKTMLIYQIHTTATLEKNLLKAYENFGDDKNKWIFSGIRDKNKPLSPQTMNRALKDLGYKDILCAHGIRSIASNFFAQHSDKIHPWTAEAMLQHSVGTKVSRAYRHDDYFNERIKASEIWNEFLDNIYRQLKKEI